MIVRFAQTMLLVLLSTIISRTLIAAEPLPPTEHWPLESASEFKLHGSTKPVDGVVGKCLVMTGDSVITIKESSHLTEGEAGFTFAAWVNPFDLEHDQRIIAGENRYSLDQRQSGLMIDRDGHFRAYFWQGGWAKIAASSRPKPGQWYLVGIIVRPQTAELWVNGEQCDSISLARPIPKTPAPLMLGGINDNGHRRQELLGALDEAMLFDRPLSADQMTSLYHPATVSAELRQLAAKLNKVASVEQFVLWKKGKPVPKTEDIPILQGVEFHVIKPYEPKRDGYGFLHGVALASHKGRLYASFGHNKGSENTETEEARYRVSDDGGKTWSDVRMIDDGGDDYGVSHGVFLQRGDELWAFHGSYNGFRKDVCTRAYVLDESTGRWQPRGVVVEGGFWPLCEPVKMDDGNWIMPGASVGNGNPAAVAISHGDNLTKWELVIIPTHPSVRGMWGESTLLVDGPRLINISRYGARAAALAAVSEDYGQTWTAMVESNLPMATSKPCAGILSTGQRYLIGTTTADSGGRRSPLTIAVSRPGENVFSKIFVIRHAVFPEGPGETDPTARLAYPYVTEHDGKLYVGYSNSGDRGGNNNSAEMAVIPLESFSVE